MKEMTYQAIYRSHVRLRLRTSVSLQGYPLHQVSQAYARVALGRAAVLPRHGRRSQDQGLRHHLRRHRSTRGHPVITNVGQAVGGRGRRRRRQRLGGEGEEGYGRTKLWRSRGLAYVECYSDGGGGQARRPNAARTNARTHARTPARPQQLSPWLCSPSCTSAAWQVHRRRQRRKEHHQADPGLPIHGAADSSPSQPTARCSVPAPDAAWRREFGEPHISGLRFARARWLARPLHFLCLHRDSATTSNASTIAHRCPRG